MQQRTITHNGETIAEIDVGTTTLRHLNRYPGYWAGNDGHIWSTKRKVPQRLKPVYNKVTKMWSVTVYRPDRKKWVKKRKGTYLMKHPDPEPIHVLVASVWLPPRPSPLHEIDHVYADRADNRPESLRWLTGQENVLAYLKLKRRMVLSDDDIRAIRSLDGTVSRMELGRRYDRNPSLISRICTGSSYKNVV